MACYGWGLLNFETLSVIQYSEEHIVSLSVALYQRTLWSRCLPFFDQRALGLSCRNVMFLEHRTTTFDVLLITSRTTCSLPRIFWWLVFAILLLSDSLYKAEVDSTVSQELHYLCDATDVTEWVWPFEASPFLHTAVLLCSPVWNMSAQSCQHSCKQNVLVSERECGEMHTSQFVGHHSLA
jgi:hypothetical protein